MFSNPEHSKSPYDIYEGAFCYNIAMNTMQMFGLIAVAFGVLVIAKPDLVGIFVGIFFILIGLNILAFGNRFGRWVK